MNTPLLFISFFLLLLGHAPLASGQVVTKWVVFANGGRFGDPSENAHLLLYDPGNGATFSPDTVQTQSVQDLLIEGHYAYLAAQDSLVKYDLVQGQRVAAAAFGAPSTIHMEVYGDYLLVGNWYGASAGNLRVFDKHSLALVDTVAGISRGATDFLIFQDSAYVVQNFSTAAFVDSAGYLAVVDLHSLSHVRDIHFPNNGEDLGRLVLLDSTLYGLNPASNTLTAYDIPTATAVTLPSGVDIQVRTNGPQIAWDGDTLFFPFNGGVGAWDLTGFAVLDSQVLDTLATALAFDTLQDRFYLTQTDFFSYAKAGIWDRAGNKVGSIPAGSAPEAVRVVYNTFPEAHPDTFVHTGTDSLFLPVLANDRDRDGDSLTVSLLVPPKNGQVLVLQGHLLLIQGAGPDSLQYQISDPWGDQDTAWVWLSSPTALEELPEEGWAVYPNPCKDQLWIQFADHTGGGNYTFSDLTGRKVQSGLLSTAPLGLQQLPGGVYLLRVNTSQGEGSKVIIKE